MVAGGAFRDGSVSILRMRNAALSRNEKSLLLAGVQGRLDFRNAAKRMRRFVDPCGRLARQNVFAATGMAARPDEEDPSYQPWVAYRDAKKKGEADRGNRAIISKGPIKLGGKDEC